MDSLRPVGMNVAPRRAPSMLDLDFLTDTTTVQRRPRTRVVIGCLVACGAILVAAGIRGARHHAQVAAPAAREGEFVVASSPAAQPSLAPAAAPQATGESPQVWSNDYPGTEPARPAAAPAPTTGTLVLRRPAAPGSVWLDGAKVTASSSVVECGTHEVRVGAHGHARSVTIPCGGELRVTR